MLAEEQPEIVICAAIAATNGQVIRCHRHHHGLRVLREMSLQPMAQGFVTSRNRFVTREDALRIQKAAGVESKSPDGYRVGQLFSEDLY